MGASSKYANLRGFVENTAELLGTRAKELQALIPYQGGSAAHYIAAFKLYAMNKPDLMECSPASICTAILRAAQTGLELGVTCDVVPFKSKRSSKLIATFMARWQGLVELAYAAGTRTINRGLHREDDYHWKFMLGSHPFVEHQPMFGSDKKILHAWAAGTRGVNNPPVIVILGRDELEERLRTFSEFHAGKSLEEIPWWPKKTAVRDLCNMLPKNRTLTLALSYDEAVEDDEPAGEAQPVRPVPAIVGTDVAAGGHFPAAEKPIATGEPADVELVCWPNWHGFPYSGKPVREIPTPVLEHEWREARSRADVYAGKRDAVNERKALNLVNWIGEVLERRRLRGEATAPIVSQRLTSETAGVGAGARELPEDDLPF